jgi:hypothetical protein
MTGINPSFFECGPIPADSTSRFCGKNEKRLLVVLLNNLKGKKLARDVSLLGDAYVPVWSTMDVLDMTADIQFHFIGCNRQLEKGGQIDDANR